MHDDYKEWHKVNAQMVDITCSNVQEYHVLYQIAYGPQKHKECVSSACKEDDAPHHDVCVREPLSPPPPPQFGNFFHK